MHRSSVLGPDPARDSRSPGPGTDRFTPYSARLQARRRADELRTLEHFRPDPGTPFVHGPEGRLLDFSSNDYLGLATDPDVIAGAVRASETYGTGATASRLVSGGLEIHERFESALADFLGRADALLFASGFQANASIIPSLVDRHGLVLCDKLSHASILHGCRVGEVRYGRFRHNDPDHLERLASTWRAKHPKETLLIVTESVFSMDGDRAPLDEIAGIAERHGALLMVDDAHAIGLFGEGGRGLAAAHDRVDLLLGTFGKAFGAAGAFVATNNTLRSHLVNFCDGQIYSTAPAPSILGAAEVALQKIRSGELDQPGYLARASEARTRLARAGFRTAPSDSQIIPIHLGDASSSVDRAAALRSRGILAVPIRPPTVPEGTARLRISLTRHHDSEHVDALIDALGPPRVPDAPS